MKITLAHPHRHNGIEFLAGQTIDLPEALGQWMIDHWHTTEKPTVAPEKQKAESRKQKSEAPTAGRHSPTANN